MCVALARGLHSNVPDPENRGAGTLNFGPEPLSPDQLPAPRTRHQGVFMSLRTDIVEARVYRRARNREVRCRLTYQVTPYRQGLFRWFLVAIEELE